MIATEAAAEGINLQFCSMLVNYDLPWNPQRVEQRIGRVHRYGQKLEQKLAAVQASTQAAIMISEAAPDDSDMRTQAVLSLMQTQLFDTLIALQEAGSEGVDPAKRLALISQCGKGIASLAQASIGQKKWMLDVRDRVEKVAKSVEEIAKKGGLSPKAAATIRKEILGIAK